MLRLKYQTAQSTTVTNAATVAAMMMRVGMCTELIGQGVQHTNRAVQIKLRHHLVSHMQCSL